MTFALVALSSVWPLNRIVFSVAVISRTPGTETSFQKQIFTFTEELYWNKNTFHNDGSERCYYAIFMKRESFFVTCYYFSSAAVLIMIILHVWHSLQYIWSHKNITNVLHDILLFFYCTISRFQLNDSTTILSPVHVDYI